MNINTVIFTQIPLTSTASKILFCLQHEKLPAFNLSLYSPSQFAHKNTLIRHDKFDWHVNKNRPICYVFEKKVQTEIELPKYLVLLENENEVQWLTFPQAVKKLGDGTARNLVQLVVQYLSYGMIDDSVLAADYDEKWIKENLKS